jgi:transaldolase
MKKQDYFYRVASQSKTRMWVNNPTPGQAEKAIEAGAINCTTNPTYVMKMLQAEPDNPELIGIIDEIIKQEANDQKAASLVQREFVKRLLDVFLPLYEAKPGQEGFVSIQGDPYAEEDPHNIINEALDDMELGKNVIAKIPVTEPGLKAIEFLIGENVPIIATEIMGISQVISTCETYIRVSEKTGKTPPLFVTHITGIFDEYLAKVVEREGIEISKDVLWQAGTIIARKQYRLMKERQYPGIMLGGGARGLHHFTEMVGGDMHVTINWKGTADLLIEQDPPVVWRMYTPEPEYAVKELLDKVPDFRRAYYEDGLSVEEYMDFGPVEHFRDSFIQGWDYLLQVIQERRKAYGSGGE